MIETDVLQPPDGSTPLEERAEPWEDAEEEDAILPAGAILLAPAPIDEEDRTALVKAEPAPLPALPQDSLQSLTLLCEYAANSGMFPSETFVSLMAKAMLGLQLGISAAAAFNGIHSIRGQSSISAELQRALALRAGYQFRCLHSDRQRCALELVVVATGEVLGNAEFTAQEAQDAGLLKNDVWQKWRADMLYHRCSTRLISRYCPHILFGLATPQ